MIIYNYIGVQKISFHHQIRQHSQLLSNMHFYRNLCSFGPSDSGACLISLISDRIGPKDGCLRKSFNGVSGKG